MPMQSLELPPLSGHITALQNEENETLLKWFSSPLHSSLGYLMNSHNTFVAASIRYQSGLRQVFLWVSNIRTPTSIALDEGIFGFLESILKFIGPLEGSLRAQ